ncbi:MAG: FISUMP domain-containing protein, partial [Ignavibacteriaceae bacterium]
KNDAYALEAVGQGMGTNTSGFSGLFAGYRTNGNFYDLGGYTDFWSSTENETTHAYYLHITYNIGSINNFNTIKKDYGFSIRCIKD